MQLTELQKIIEKTLKVDLNDQSRKRELIDAKRIFAFIAVRKLGISLTDTGIYLKKHHATIIHYLKGFEYILHAEKQFYTNYYNCLLKIQEKIEYDESPFQSKYDYHLEKARKYAKLIHS